MKKYQKVLITKSELPIKDQIKFLLESKNWEPEKVRNATMANEVFKQFDVFMNEMKTKGHLRGDVNGLITEIEKYIIPEINQFLKEAKYFHSKVKK